MSTMRISANFQAFLQRVETIDLKPLAYQLIQLHKSSPQVEAAIARYLAFLFLVDQYPLLPLVPTAEIDQVWHCHILDTRNYAADCQVLFGRFVDHFPYFGVRSEGDRQSQLQAYALTQALMKDHFGDRFAGSALPSDCEPLLHVNEAGCAALTERYTRPGIEISMSEVFAQFWN